MEEKALIFKNFEDIPVSTKTFIIATNITINIEKLFDFLPITNYIIIPKKRGRKKKVVLSDPNKNIKSGSIITLELKNKIRGVSLKKKKKESSGTDYFRNSVTVVMINEGKKINFKISKNGKFQMTGCKNDKQAEDCVKFIWNSIKNDNDLYTKKENEPFQALFIPAMRNIDFNLGFVVDREKLDDYINGNTEYNSLFETSIGYTGVNIKIPVISNLGSLKLKRLTFKGETKDEKENDWTTTSYIPYQDYLSTLEMKEQRKKLGKERNTTFLVFQSGKTICSAMCEEFAKEAYNRFIDIIKQNINNFIEK